MFRFNFEYSMLNAAGQASERARANGAREKGSILGSDYDNWLGEKRAETCIKNLKKRQFDACFADSEEKARALVFKMVGSFETFGIGGSSTVRELGIADALRNAGKTVHDHWQPDLSPEQDFGIRLAQGRCDMFFCSANAISVEGEIVNVDGIGNRTSAMTFGPKKVVIVAGTNKLASDLDSALKRVREVAAPMRAKSLGIDTPCAATGFCSDCASPQRICRITTILHCKPMLTEMSVVLVNRRLGF